MSSSVVHSEPDLWAKVVWHMSVVASIASVSCFINVVIPLYVKAHYRHVCILRYNYHGITGQSDLDYGLLASYMPRALTPLD